MKAACRTTSVFLLNYFFKRQTSDHVNELVENKEKDVAKKLYTETHLISLIPYVKNAMDNNINESMFGEWLINFFKTENDSDVYTAYMEATSNGVARNASIIARHKALEESYGQFFKEEKSNLYNYAINSQFN